MTLARGEREWALLVSEYNICKKKLESKRQALKILMGDLESCQRERDIYKTKIKQLQQEVDNYKKQEIEVKGIRGGRSPVSRSPEHNKSIKRERRLSGNSIWEQELQNVRDRKNKTLSQLLCESREENKALVNDFKDLRVLYREAQEDILLLRENLARQRSNSKGQGTTEELHARQNVIRQLEDCHEREQQLERDLQAAKDETNEIAIERDHYREKTNRLNTQLNYILGADDRRLVDIDAVLMENRYQKEQIKQLKEEKAMASSALSRYKNAFEKKKSRLLKAGYGQTGHAGGHGVKQAFPAILSDLTHSFGGGGMSNNTASELQFLANSLSESLSEKDIALLHQRNTNRILGIRVAELEKKLKTLEVSGLWSLEGHRGYGSDEMGRLTLRRSPRTPSADTTQQVNAHNGDAGDSPPNGSPTQERDDETMFLFKDQALEDVEESCLVNVNSDDSNPTLSEEEYELDEGATIDPSMSSMDGDSSIGSKGDSPVGSKGDSHVGSKGDSSIGSKGDSPVGSKGDSPVGSKGDSPEASRPSNSTFEPVDGNSEINTPITLHDSTSTENIQEGNIVQEPTTTDITSNEEELGESPLGMRESPTDIPDDLSHQIQSDPSDVESELMSSLSMREGGVESSTQCGEGNGITSVLLSPVDDNDNLESVVEEDSSKPLSDNELKELLQNINNTVDEG